MPNETCENHSYKIMKPHNSIITPLVSVIIPTYNRAKFVVEAIESVLNQSFQNYELIVVDDGSSDDTRQVLQPYLSTIKYIYQENAGVSAAINTGIRAARGEWLAVLGSDDLWAREYLSTQIEQVNKFPHAVGHITNTVMVSLDGSKRNHFEEIHFFASFKKGSNILVLKKPLRTIIKYPFWFTQSTILHRNTLLQAGLFNENLSIAEDLDVIARVAFRGEFTFCKETFVYTIRRKEEILSLAAQSSMNNVMCYKSFEKVYTDLLKLRGLSSMEKITIASALSNSLRIIGNCLVIDGRITEARKFYWKSFISSLSAKSLVKFVVTFLPKFISRLLIIKGRDMTPGEYEL